MTGLKGLVRRYRMPVAITGFALGALACIAYAVYVTVDPPGPPNTDGAAYVFMGAVYCAAGFAGGAIALFTTSRRRHVPRRPLPPPGWYADPSDGTRWRWWDGSQWTSHTG